LHSGAARQSARLSLAGDIRGSLAGRTRRCLSRDVIARELQVRTTLLRVCKAGQKFEHVRAARGPTPSEQNRVRKNVPEKVTRASPAGVARTLPIASEATAAPSATVETKVASRMRATGTRRAIRGAQQCGAEGAARSLLGARTLESVRLLAIRF
jgi:hypothetical protein